MSVTHFTIFLMSFPTDEAYLRKLIHDLHQVCHAIEEQWAQQQAEEDHPEEEHEEEEHPEEEEEEEEDKQPPKQEVPRANRSLPFPCLLIKTGQRKFYHKFNPRHRNNPQVPHNKSKNKRQTSSKPQPKPPNLGWLQS